MSHSVDADQRRLATGQTHSGESSYYYRRADQHCLMAERAKPEAAAVHREMAAAYRAAADAVEHGEAVDFGGWHRGESR